MNVGFTLLARAQTPSQLKFSLLTARNHSPLVKWAHDEASQTTVVLLGRLFYKKDLGIRVGIVPEKYGDDAELILSAFVKSGPNCLSALEGEFALAIGDYRNRCLYAARDASSAWPLFWTARNGTLAVGTSLEELVRLQPQRALDFDYLGEYFMRPAAIAELACEETPWIGVRRVLPGTILCLRENKLPQQLRIWDWSSRVQMAAEQSLADVGQRFAQLFREAVRECLSEGPVAAHLSGGMDSSSVVCVARDILASRAGQGPLGTVTKVYEGRNMAGERAFAEMVIEQAPGLEPRFLPADEILDFDWFNRPFPPHDEPYGWLPRLAGERLLFEAAKQLGAKTVLTGIGADEILDCYPLSIADLLGRGRWLAAWRRAATWARAQNRGVWSVLQDYGFRARRHHGFASRFRLCWRGGYGKWPHLDSFDIPPWICPEFAQRHRLRARGQEQARRIYRRPYGLSMDAFNVESGIGNWASWFLAAPCGMQVSHPFRDPRLVTYCMGIPEHWRAIPGVRKPVLQEATRGLLPEVIRTRPDKCHFNDIYWVGLARHLGPLRDMVQSSASGDLGIFDKAELLKVMELASLGTGDAMSCERLNKTLALIAWHDGLRNPRPAPHSPVALSSNGRCQQPLELVCR